MPAPERPSRKLPSVVAAPMVAEAVVQTGQTEEELLAVQPRRVSTSVLVSAVAVLLVAAAAGVGFELRRTDAAVPSEPIAVPVVAAAEPVIDAGPESEAVADVLDSGSAPPPVEAAPPPRPAVVASPIPVESRPKAPVAKGSLVVHAIPYAMLKANGLSIGEAQGTRTFSLPVGTYELTFSHPLQTRKEAVVIRAGQTVEVSFDARAK